MPLFAAMWPRRKPRSRQEPTLMREASQKQPRKFKHRRATGANDQDSATDINLMQRWIYEKLMVCCTAAPSSFLTPRISAPSICRGHLPTRRVFESPSSERKMHFTCARGGSPGARDEAWPSLCFQRPSTRPSEAVLRAACKYCWLPCFFGKSVNFQSFRLRLDH
jgi:hypothetical protein